MKKGIHPEYKETKVSCTCGNSFIAGSVVDEIRVEICNKCHPFFTGVKKIMDTGGRIEKFKERYRGHLTYQKVDE